MTNTHRSFAAVVLVAAAALLAGCSSGPRAAYGVRAEPPVPTAAVTASAYPYYLYIHCGIRYADFSGRWWEADHPGPRPAAAGASNTEAYGTMTLIDADHARFQGDGVPTVDFHPYAGTPPPCS